jgi:hypothetical protein
MSAENSVEDIVYHDIITWWEIRRLKYCLILTILLPVCVIVYIYFSNRIYYFNFRFQDVFQDAILPLILYILLFCNICYTAGWVFESFLTYWFKWNFKDIHRNILYITGLFIAILIPFYDLFYRFYL